MSIEPIHITRTTIAVRPDQSRVLLRPFNPGDVTANRGLSRGFFRSPRAEVLPLLDEVLAEFSTAPSEHRRRLSRTIRTGPESAVPGGNLSEARKLLIGSYFVSEYSLESAALFNPSIVPHPDQSGVPPNGLRFILSLRATGEGHLSSITFRTGMIYPDGRIEVMNAAGYLSEPRQIPNPLYEKVLFERKLHELGLTNEFTRRTMQTARRVVPPGRTALRAWKRNCASVCRMAKRAHRTPPRQSGGWPTRTIEVQFSPDQELVRAHHLSGLAFAAKRHRGRPVRPLSRTTTARTCTTPPSPPMTAES